MKKKRSKSNFASKKDSTIEKKIDDNDAGVFERYTHSIDIREKRIGIVFKVIYVFAIFFVTLLMMISDDTGEGISTTYIITVCAIAFLLCLLLKMIIYIFNELKCFKLNNEELSRWQITKTEECYERIFNYFINGGATSLFMAIIIGCINVYLTQNILMGFFVGGMVLGSVIDNAQLKKHKHFWHLVSDIIWTIVIIFIMVSVRLGEMS